MDSTKIVQGLYDAFGRGDVPSVLGAFDDAIEWHEAQGGPYGGVYRSGDEVVRNVFGPIMADVPDFAVTPERFVADADTVAVIARYTGTGASTKRRLDLPVVHVWTIRDDKVVRFRQFVDTVKFCEVVPRDVAADA